MATTVIIFGPDALDRADHDRLVEVGPRERPSLRGPLGLQVLQRLVEVDQHDDAGLGGDAGERDEADRHRDRQVEPEPPHQPDAADQREGQRQHHDQRLGDPAEVEVEQQEDDQQRDRHDDLQARLGPLQVLELAAPLDVGAGRELHLVRDRLPRLGDIAAEVAAGDVDEDVDRELAVLGADRGRAAGELDLGHLAERHGAAAGQRHLHLASRWPAGSLRRSRG